VTEDSKIIEGEGKYLRSQRKYWAKMKRKLVGMGKNKHTGGGKGHTRPSFPKGEPSPAGWSVLEEDNEPPKRKKIIVKIKKSKNKGKNG